MVISGLVITGAVLVWWVAWSALEAWDSYRWQKKTDTFMEALLQPYKKDTYGGKTPEETWALFLQALKIGDVELASKYFVVEKQDSEKQRLQESVKLNKLNQALEFFSQDLVSENQGGRLSEKKYYYISVKNEAGETEGYPVIFSINQYTKVWKISSL